MQNGHRHLQIALHLFHRRRPGRHWLPLRFQKQFRLRENALASHPRAFAPGRVELPCLPRVAMMCHETGGHTRAVVSVDASHRHQIFHRHLRPEFALAHLLLDRFRQQLHQRQPPRYPTRAAVEAPRQLVERVGEALFHLRQQPACFDRTLLRTAAQRSG